MNQRILVIDDQEAIHEDYRKIISPRRKSDNTAIFDQMAAELFDELQAADVDEPFVGFEVDCASQGQEGYQRVEQALRDGRPYSLAFVDIRMPPGWDGIETVTHIWKIDPELLIVLCSAYSDYSWEKMIKQLGRTDRFLVLKKPFDTIEVQQMALALTEKWRLARTDVLTGLLNRRAFDERLAREWKRATQHGHPLSCILLDIDFFKRINDIHGHAQGDAVLRAVADCLRSSCRATDSVCRSGGEELAILLPETTEEEAAQWAESVRIAIAALEFPDKSKPFHITVSLGVAQRFEDLATPYDLLDRADQALLVAKQSGRNRVVTHTFLGGSLVGGMSSGRLTDDLFTGVLARDVMTECVACLRQTLTIGAAADFFVHTRITAAPVVDAEGKLCGIVSEKDVMGVMLDKDAWHKPLSEITQLNVVSYGEDTAMRTVFDFLCRVAIRRVIIVRDGRPCGVISRGCLLRWFANWVLSHTGDPACEDHKIHDLREDAVKPWQTETARVLADKAQRLVEALDEDTDDAVPQIISEVSKMQELMHDLLAYSGYRNQHHQFGPVPTG